MADNTESKPGMDELDSINVDPVFTKHTVKDSVFHTLFTDKENVLELYKGFHPEDTRATADDVYICTLKTIFVNDLFNDLGFVVGKGEDARFMVLVEAQSKWNPNMTLRILFYLVTSIRNYLIETNQNLHEDTRIKLPPIELYLIYTGGGNPPEVISFRDDYFNGEGPVDLQVTIRHRPGKTLDGQYIGFCQVYNEQRKIYGKNKKCMEETIRICLEKGYLVDFLQAHREEVVTMMDELFDAEYQLESYMRSHDAKKIAEGEARGEARGIEKGKIEGAAQEKVSLAINLIRMNMGSLEKIAEATGLPLSKIEELANTDVKTA